MTGFCLTWFRITGLGLTGSFNDVATFRPICFVFLFGLFDSLETNGCMKRNGTQANKLLSGLFSMGEIEALVSKVSTCMGGRVVWSPAPDGRVKINFDAAFLQSQNKSCSGVVIRDTRGRILASKTVMHKEVGSPFAAEAFACLQARGSNGCFLP